MCLLQYYEKEFTLWDRFEIQGEMTMKEFMEYFEVALLYRALYCKH